MIVIRALSVLFAIFAAALLVGAALGLEGLAIAMYVTVALTTPVLVALPALALARLVAMRRNDINKQLLVMGRVSALMFVIAGLVILRGAVSDASAVSFVVAALFAAFGAWLFTRSWKLLPAAPEERRVWPYYVPFGLSVLVALVISAMLLSGRFETPTSHAYRTANEVGPSERRGC